MTILRTGCFLLCFLLFFGTTLQAADQNVAAISPQEQADFQLALAKAIDKLALMQKQKAFQRRKIHQSMQKTLDATTTLMKQRNYPAAERLLIEARQLYPLNALAELMLGDVLESQGKQSEANNAYLAFLNKAGKATWITQELISIETRYAIAAYVRKKLLAQGIDAPQPKGMLRLPLSARLALEKSSWIKFFASTALPFMVVLGAVFLMLRDFLGMFNAVGLAWYRTFPKIYAVTIIAYVMWLAYLFFDLEPWMEPAELSIVVFMAIGIAVIVAIEALRQYRTHREIANDPDLILCSKCHSRVLKIWSSCPKCGREL